MSGSGSEYFLNGTSAQLGYTVLFKLVVYVGLQVKLFDT